MKHQRQIFFFYDDQRLALGKGIDMKGIQLKAINKTLGGAVIAVAAMAAITTNPAFARGNIVDAVSNPNQLDFDDVEMRNPDFAPTYKRDGVFLKPQLLQQVSKGTAASQVQTMLGQPEKTSTSSQGVEWEYNVKLPLPDSNNTLVCQYKVVVDQAQAVVVDAVWRRHQCLDIVNAKN